MGRDKDNTYIEQILGDVPSPSVVDMLRDWFGDVCQTMGLASARFEDYDATHWDEESPARHAYMTGFTDATKEAGDIIRTHEQNTSDNGTVQRLERLLVEARQEVESLKRVHQIGGYGKALITLSTELDEADKLIELFGKSLLGEMLLGTTKLYVRTQDWLKNREASKGQ